MPRRKVFKGIAGGIASGFSSRLNDVDGYWALGILYKCADESNLNKFSLNLLTGESSPTFKYSGRIATRYREFLFNQMDKIGLELYQLERAIVTVDFNISPTNRQVIFKYTWGEPFVCNVKLTDDLGKIWCSEFRGWCGKHDPKKERRSIRQYAS